MSTPVVFLIVRIVAFFVEVSLGGRIALKALGANHLTPFVAWVYDLSAPYVGPFGGIFEMPQLGAGGILDTPAIFAFAVYAFLAYFITRLVDFVKEYQKEEAESLEIEAKKIVAAREMRGKK